MLAEVPLGRWLEEQILLLLYQYYYVTIILISITIHVNKKQNARGSSPRRPGSK